MSERRDLELIAELVPEGSRVLESFGMQDGEAVRRWPNLRASVAVFKFERG